MGRQPCCVKVGLKRGPWTNEEDHKLRNFILNNGVHCWRMVPKLAGLLRCGKSCRLRWINYLRPDLKRGSFTEDEEDEIIQLHSLLGNRWSKIAAHFPGRTDNEIKNHWNTRIKKRLKELGLDPVTHKPVHEQQQQTTDRHDEKHYSEAIVATTEQEIDDHHHDKKELLVITDELLLNNHDMPSTSCSTTNTSSFSWEESNYNPSMGGTTTTTTTTETPSLEQWFDNNVDSLLSWDCFNQLEDIFFLFGN